MGLCILQHAGLLVLYVSVSSVAAYSCTESSLKSCLGDMLSVAQKAQGGALPSYTANEFKKVCREFKEASQTCLPGIRSSCGRQDQLALDLVKEMFDYLCGEGFNVYINNSACFLDKKLMPGIRKCVDTFQAQTQQLQRSSGSKEYRLEQLCKNTNTYVKCSVDLIKSSCGADAGDLMLKLSRKIFDFTFRQVNFNCPINGAVGVTVSLTSLLISFVMLLKNSL